jgi:hypothetical protein
MSDQLKIKPEEWPAYGPEKEQWKAAGNYFSAEELRRMADDFKDLKIKRRRRKVYNAN